MAMEQARAYLKQYHKEQDILVLDASSATVEQAAQAMEHSRSASQNRFPLW